MRSSRDLLLTYFDILLECVRPRKVWQIGGALGIANIRVKRHVKVLVDANLLREVDGEFLNNQKDTSTPSKAGQVAKSFMCTPLANSYFEALGEYYRKYRGNRIAIVRQEVLWG